METGIASGQKVTERTGEEPGKELSILLPGRLPTGAETTLTPDSALRVRFAWSGVWREPGAHKIPQKASTWSRVRENKLK